MSVSATLTKQFSEHVAAEREGLAETYRDAVRAAANGTPPAYEDIMLLCQAAERTPDDFVRDVEALERRRELVTKIEDVNELESQVREALDGVDKEKDKLKAQQERVEAAESEVRSLRHRIARTRKIKDELIRSCTDPALLNAYHEQDRQVKRIGAQHKDARDHLQSLNEEARHLKYELSQGRGSADERRLYQRQLDELRSEIPTADETVRDLQQQVADSLAELRVRELALAEV